MITAQEIIDSFEELKTIPHIALRICHLIDKEDITVRELEEALQLDPVLISRLLRMVNSAYYGLRQPVENIARAMVLLGLKNLRNLIVIDAMKGFFLENGDESIFSRKQLWKHCNAVGVCARMIARRLLGTTGEDAFLAGILHDIGMIVEDQIREPLFRTAIQRYCEGEGSLIEYEREILGTDHCVVGGILATKWGFPAVVYQVITSHHDLIETKAELENMAAVVQIAHYLVDSTGYSEIANKVENPGVVVADHIRSQAAEYRVLASDFVEEIEKAASLYEVAE
jgi:putative nucleotidyltransferase with HDIG domain